MSNLIELKINKHQPLINRGIDLLAEQKCTIPSGLGNNRWTQDLIISTFYQAKTGQLPPMNLNYKTGASNGGFDLLDFDYSETVNGTSIDPTQFDLSIELNRRDTG